MRIFIAIDFEKELKSYLQEKQNEVRSYCSKGNFSNQENFHLTIKFIGEVGKAQISSIQKAMDDVAEACEEFELELSKLGSFKRQNEHIIWIGLEGELSKLNHLYESIQLELSKIGIPKENKPLKPHITLGRRVQVKEDFDKITNKIIIDKNTILVKSIVLMKSTRINGKLTYLPIYEKRLF